MVPARHEAVLQRLVRAEALRRVVDDEAPDKVLRRLCLLQYVVAVCVSVVSVSLCSGICMYHVTYIRSLSAKSLAV